MVFKLKRFSHLLDRSFELRSLIGLEALSRIIGSTQKCVVILKFKRFFHLSNLFFGLGSPIRLETLSLVLH